MLVEAAHHWPTNAHLIADVAKLGYLDGTVLDATYGDGNFWTQWKPDVLVTNDLYKIADYAWDYRTRYHTDTYDSVVFDPPYKLRGTPAQPAFDDQYGIEKAMRWQDIMDDIRIGAENCYRIARRYLLVKCKDQVVSGKVRWQTNMVTTAIGVEHLVDRFDYLKTPQPQKAGRRRVHASRNYSTLLVFGADVAR